MKKLVGKMLKQNVSINDNYSATKIVDLKKYKIYYLGAKFLFLKFLIVYQTLYVSLNFEFVFHLRVLDLLVLSVLVFSSFPPPTFCMLLFCKDSV